MIVGMVFLQRERFCKKRNIHNHPRKIFIDDLVKFITIIKVSSNKVILAADINKHMVDGKLAKALK